MSLTIPQILNKAVKKILFFFFRVFFFGWRKNLFHIRGYLISMPGCCMKYQPSLSVSSRALQPADCSHGCFNLARSPGGPSQPVPVIHSQAASAQRAKAASSLTGQHIACFGSSPYDIALLYIQVPSASVSVTSTVLSSTFKTTTSKKPF